MPNQHALTDADLLAAYAPPSGPFVRFNFVSSLDGAATVDGVSAALGGEADSRLFALLRWHADVVLIGAGTLRAEGYEGDLVDAAARQWRADRGLPAHPGIAVISGELQIEADSDFFVHAPVRPVLLTTTAAASSERAERLAEQADIVAVGETITPAGILAACADRSWQRIHAEGGPHVLGTFIDADAVDSFCLTLAPWLTGGQASRIATSRDSSLRRLALHQVLVDGDELLLEYRRASHEGALPRP
ncbi:pyrimidine reductase family protein [Zhihengliuella flava]|uniref:Riboflavin biosynthesis pyrimidine reductase n=1 Tax=Zhihengliuella flava TaxID=1285193 RepID=A0A931DF21_9MICC|nr:pyrimidine reductase family protein [Zhihengliuella flava]MBG6085598.1 riboflavin biosynthesis pyrimidine reductase [Zhihengliuella flava]